MKGPTCANIILLSVESIYFCFVDFLVHERILEEGFNLLSVLSDNIRR